MQEDAIRLLLISGNPDTKDALLALLQSTRSDSFTLESAHPLSITPPDQALEDFDLLLLDYPGTAESGQQLLNALLTQPAPPPVLLLTHEQHLRGARDAVRMGARDYLVLDCLEPSQLSRALQLCREGHPAREETHSPRHFDAQTGLPNEHWLTAATEHAIAGAQRECRQLALFLLELKGLSRIGAAFGPSAEQHVLLAITRRLSLSVRRGDTLSRVGPHSFALLVPDVIGTGELALINRKLIAAVTQPISFGKHTLMAEGSLGVAVYPESGKHPAQLLDSAQEALRTAKVQPGSHSRIHQTEHAPGPRGPSLHESELRRAVRRNEFELHYQPRISLQTGRVCAIEALVRWRHPEKGLLSPKEFLHQAEQSGLIIPLGYQLVQQAIDDAREMDTHGLPALPLILNLSQRQLLDASFIPTITRLLHRGAVAPGRLQFEIKEKAVNVGDDALSQLHALGQLGVSLALDDYGAGSTPIPLLQRLPIDTLCIDRHFVRNMHKSADDQALLKALISLARSLGLRTVAKGAEEAHQVDSLQALNCDEVQGFYFSPALDSRALIARLRSHLHETAV